jgi:hypothetical protein
VRVDHNDFGPKTVLGNTIMLSGAGSQIVQQTRLDHNYFHDVRRLIVSFFSVAVYRL